MKFSALFVHRSRRLPRAFYEPSLGAPASRGRFVQCRESKTRRRDAGAPRFMVPMHAKKRKDAFHACLLIAIQLFCLPLMTHCADLGLFEKQADIGNPSKAGSAVFESSTGTYLVSGGGENMLFTNQAFHFCL